MRLLAANLFLLLGSALTSLVVAELVLRVSLDEVNYLRPTLRDDPRLGRVIVPGSGGHDRLGFRNPRVPDRAEVVAIGDSQTYGVSASADRSYPAWYQQLSGSSVYNMALGGWGPVEYRQLLDQALGLSPRLILIGFYFGNDLADVRRRTRPGAAGTPPAALDRRQLKGVRDWLSGHSLLYQVLKLQLGALSNQVRLREATRSGLEGLVLVEHPVLTTLLEPEKRLRALDQRDHVNRAVLDETLEILGEIHLGCEVRDVDCVFLLIPTKESVYWELVDEALEGRDRERIRAVVDQEEIVRRRLVGFFEEGGIAYVDPLPRMRRAARSGALYPANQDGHPTAEGYRLVALSILDTQSSASSE